MKGGDYVVKLGISCESCVHYRAHNSIYGIGICDRTFHKPVSFRDTCTYHEHDGKERVAFDDGKFTIDRKDNEK